MVADTFDPAYPRRPQFGPEGVAPPVAPGDLPYDALLHVHHRFEYHRHACAGETLTARRLPPTEWTKQGRRGGRLEFVETVTEFVDATGRVAISSAWTDVRPEAGHRAMSTAPPGEASAAGAPTDGAEGVVVVRDLSRTQIVMYVGIAGDFHPLHHDDAYAVAQGYPSIFAPGMLTMALTGRAVTDTVGDGRLRTFSGRLTGQVWPGTTLRVGVTPTSPNEWKVVTVDQDRRVVFDGTATTTCPSGPSGLGVS
jgi:acyl dehydratase